MLRGSVRGPKRLAARAGLVPVAALAVHQLRFMLAFGGSAGAELKQTGHSYLHSLVPWIVLLVGISFSVFLWAFGQAVAGKRSASKRGLSFVALWFVCALCLLAVYCTQEFLEGLLATGHPTGIAGIFGFGGLWSIPSAVGVGLVLATLMYGASWTLAEVGRRRDSLPELRPRRVPLVGRAHDILRGPVEPLVRGWCDRGPPFLV